MGRGGEFNRVDRDGDYMEGTLDHRDEEIQWTDGAGTPYARIRHNGNDMEFYDIETGGWKKLVDMTNSGLTSAIMNEQTAGAGVYTYVVPAYPVGINAMQVYVGGMRLPSTAFTEDDTTHVTILVAEVVLYGGEQLIFTIPKGIAQQYMMMVSGADTAPAFAESKIVAGANVTVTKTNPAGNETLVVAASDENAKVSANDTTPGVLIDKLAAGTGISITETNDGADEDATIALANGTAGAVRGFSAAGAPAEIVPVAVGRVLTDGGPGVVPTFQVPMSSNPAVDELKNAVLVASGTVTLSGASSSVSVLLETVNAHRFYWGSFYHTVLGMGIEMTFGNGPSAAGPTSRHYVKFTRTSGVGTSVPINYKIYRIDET